MSSYLINLQAALSQLGFSKEASETSNVIQKSFKQQLIDMRGDFAKIAQNVYDDWIQNEEGYSESHLGIGYGGICHIIADKIISHIYQLGAESKLEACSVSDSYVQHVYVIAWFEYPNPDYIERSESEEEDSEFEEESEKMLYDIFSIDIPYYVYEEGGGFTWKKIDNVKFDERDVVIDIVETYASKSRLDEIIGQDW